MRFRSSLTPSHRWSMAAAALVVGVLVDVPAAAHGVGSSQLRLRVNGPRVEGAWEVPLRDAQVALQADATTTGEAG